MHYETMTIEQLISGGPGPFQCLEESGVSLRKRGVLKQHLSTKTRNQVPTGYLTVCSLYNHHVIMGLK